MKPLAFGGGMLIILGIAGLIYGRLNYTTEDKVLDLGPIHATAETNHTVPIPDIASITAVVAGLVLVAIGVKRT
jgi:hypothetical protein